MKTLFTAILFCILFPLLSVFLQANPQTIDQTELVATYFSGGEFGGTEFVLERGGRYRLRGTTDTTETIESGTYRFVRGILYFRVLRKTEGFYDHKKRNVLGKDKMPTHFVLIPLKWSGRIYLLDNNDLESLDFCNEINLGLEPRKKLIAGEFFLRKGDETKEVVGQPFLRSPWSSYLLVQPVTASIIKIEAEGKPGKKNGVVLIDKGSADGLRAGMALVVETHSDDYEPYPLFEPKVISVGEHTARLGLDPFDKLVVGTKLSTKFTPGSDFQWWANH